jgi:predicted PurR-regulated permease PerM
MNERKGFLLALILVFGTLALLMLKAFTPYILGAMIIAFILRKPHFSLKEKIGERPSAFILTFAAIVLAVLPLIVSAAAVANDASDLVKDVNRSQLLDMDGVESRIYGLTGQNVDIQATVSSALQSFSSKTLGSFSHLVSVVTSLTIGLSVMLFLIYYFLKDGRKLIKWTKDLSPLPEQIEDDLFDKLGLTSSAVLKGHLLVALAQGVIAGIGLAVLGVPNYLFWTFMMAILAVLPIVGSFLIWFPAALYLIYTGNVTNGLILILYGAIVVGATDNLLRPFVVDAEADLHPALIITGVLGGVSVFGVTGLFIGPIVLGALKSILAVYMKHYNDL